jgi:hypothetical protein
MNKVLQLLFNQFVKQYGRKPNNLESILLKQKAMKEALDKRKVISMVDRQPIDPNKPIMGGQQSGMFDNIFNKMQSQMGKKPNVVKSDKEIKAALEKSNKDSLKNLKDKLDDPDKKADGGRIGLKDGISLESILEGKIPPVSMPDPLQKILEKMTPEEKEMFKMRMELMKKGFIRNIEPNPDAVKPVPMPTYGPDGKRSFAKGGRIGYAMGSEGVMKMASVDEPFFRDDYLDENAEMMFKKPYKDLTPDELEEFREEMMRLMNKFSSAPDPMDERNMVMENIAAQEFGKPLKDLSEDEIIQIEEMMDEMGKKDRGAPSIKLAAEGGIMRVGLKDGVLKRGLKSITGSDTYKTLEDKGFNTAVGLQYAFDEIFNILSGLPGLAEGGRIGYKDGPPDPTKRKFIKAAVGIASMIPGIGMIGKGAKVAAPVVAKAAELTGPALAKIVETVMDFGKLISVKGRRVKEMVTKKKHKGVEVEEDIADGSYIIKKDNKEIYYKPGRMDETGGVEDDIIEIIEDRIKKAGGGLSYMLGE